MTRARIDTVVRVRRLQERVAQALVHRERREVAEREQREAHTEARLGDLAAAPPRAAERLRDHRSRVEGGVREYLQAGLDVEAARVRLDDSLADWTVTARRRDGVERLDERMRVAATLDEQRRAATELDDLVVTRWKHNER